ncbi:hypothetical protein [Natrinema salifodinae]|uniref:Uncharacterized protein n=1 Tax=Natrinema salifodinae TaxID=1202768 RepID=A0A1I0QAW0_9EURY|nr:hypothetical protein [Natrinema salifodinae]SEW24167.1 hypothetical protein SAMN05216285_3321 [Natrinema salifodinae]
MVSGHPGLGGNRDRDQAASASASTATTWRVTRREALAALGGAGLASAVGAPDATTARADAARRRRNVVRVRIYPGVVPLHARLRYGVDGLDDLRGAWPDPLADAMAAVENALEQVLTYARERGRLEALEIRVERGDQIRFPAMEMPLSSEAVLPSLETLLGRFRERLRARDALTGRTSHVLLHWSPLNYRVGYGGTLSPHSLVGDESDGSDGDAQTVANVGATEVWDSRAVTRNVAIHETIHTFLADDVVAEIGDAVCDHELGTAVRTDDDTLRISPIATAYAGPDRLGGGTRFQGTGCYDRERFVRHDGVDGIKNWTYTTELSEATREGVARTLERQFEA